MNDFANTMDDAAEEAFDALIEMAEPRFAAALVEQGGSAPSRIPNAQAAEIFGKVVLATAAQHAPEADLNALDQMIVEYVHRHPSFFLPVARALEQMTLAGAHPLFRRAVQRARAQAQTTRDIFAPAVGPDCAIMMAGHGLPVAPLDKRSSRLLAPVSNDIGVVAQNFASFKTAYVGYSTCAAPFYLLLTDCVRTLRQRMLLDDRLKDVRRLIEPSNQRWPTDEHDKQQASVFFGRQPGDRFETIALMERNPHQWSIVLYAGWLEESEPMGAPCDGCVPVPLSLVRAVFADPVMLNCPTPVASRSVIMH
jgi:hypothetical protein